MFLSSDSCRSVGGGEQEECSRREASSSLLEESRRESCKSSNTKLLIDISSVDKPKNDSCRSVGTRGLVESSSICKLQSDSCRSEGMGGLVESSSVHIGGLAHFSLTIRLDMNLPSFTSFGETNRTLFFTLMGMVGVAVSVTVTPGLIVGGELPEVQEDCSTREASSLLVEESDEKLFIESS
jgi:hypothetical protein